MSYNDIPIPVKAYYELFEKIANVKCEQGLGHFFNAKYNTTIFYPDKHYAIDRPDSISGFIVIRKETMPEIMALSSETWNEFFKQVKNDEF